MPPTKRRRKPVLPTKVYRLSVSEAKYSTSGKKRAFTSEKEAIQAYDWHVSQGNEVTLFVGDVKWREVQRIHVGEELQKRLI